MLKFRYSMQGILDLKYRLEDQAKGVFAAAKIRVEEEQERIDLLKNERLSYEEGLQKLKLGTLDFREIQVVKVGIEAKEDVIKKQNRVLLRAEHEMEAASERLRELMVDRKTHETLKDKAFENYLLEMAGEEKKETDELVSYRFNNRQE